MGLYLKSLRWMFWSGLALLLLSRWTHGASFYGDGFVHMKTMTSSSHTSLHIRFCTPCSSGLLFLAVGQTDYLLVELLSGHVQVTLELGSGKQVLHSEKGRPLNDMAWHSVTLRHEHRDVTLVVDNRYQSSLKMPGSEKELIVEDGLFLGGHSSLVKPFLLQNQTGFRGCIDKALFNERDLLLSLRPCPSFRDVHEVQPGCSLQFSAAADDPVGFLSSRAYMALPPWNAQSDGWFECLLRTSSHEGIILYSSAHHGGFVALKIREGLLVAVVGKGQAQNQLRSLSLINDEKWHTVRLHFTTRRLTLKVDTEILQASIDSPSQALQLSGPLYVGGVDDVIHMAVRKMGLVSGSSRHARGVSFQGCLKNITVNAVRMGIPSAMVTKDIFLGCELQKDMETNVPRTQRTVNILTPSASPAQPVHMLSFIEGLENNDEQNFLILRDLVVAEGGYAVLEAKHFKVNLDSLEMEASQSLVWFRITEQPVHGQLRLDVDQDQEENTFSFFDLQQRRVLYIHGGSEDRQDFFMFSVFANSEREVPNYMNENITYRYNITVTPTNDAPELSLPGGNLFVLLENSKKLLTPDVLKATDIDSSSADLVFSVLGGLNADAGFLEVDINPGNAVTTFSHSDLEDGKVRYVHTGVRNSKITFRVSDGDKESNTVVLRIMAIRLEYKIVNNTGLEVTQGSMTLIGSRHLAVQTNAINQTVEIRYDVIEPPQYGELQRLHSSGEWKPVSTFSQRLLDKERLKYLSTFSEIQTGNITDHFKCKVKVGPRDTDELVFPISVRWIQYKLIRNDILEVNKIRRVALNSQYLNVITQGVQLSDCEIYFRLNALPKKGNLLLNNMILQKNSSFSQRNVTDLKVQYELVDQPRINTQDMFTFQVFSKHAHSGNYDFRISIEVDMDTIFIENNGLSVIEGGSKHVTRDALYSETLGTKEVYYTIKNGPRHGKLKFYNTTSGSITVFTNKDILEERIIYIHDGSETMHDQFTFVASINQISVPSLNWSNRAVDGTFKISVQPVNDEKPIQVVNKVFHVVRDGQKLLTLDDLCFHDPDSDFNDEQLVYTRRVVPMGELVMVNDTSRKLYRFLQRDLGQKQVLFVHRGVSSGRFVLFVSDGKHHSSTLLDVSAHDPYLRIDNRTDLLVQKGHASVFTSSRFSVDTNMDVRDDREISYNMIVRPQHGGLYYGNVTVDSFTQQDLKMGHLFYHHDGSSTLVDSFSFTVRVKELRLSAGINVRAYLRSQEGPLKVMRNETLRVEEGKSVPINKTALEVAHEDSLFPEIVYTVKIHPAHGYLWRFGNSGTEKTAVGTFSQADVNSGVIRYVQMEPGQSEDAFELDATDGVAEVSDVRVSVDIIPQYIPLWVSSITVQEGASKALSEEIIKVADQRFSAPSLLYTVISPPQQGRIEHSHFPGMPIITFTGKQVEQAIIRYVHEGSGVLEDGFTLIASDADQRTESLPQTVHVRVAAGNSNAPVITANRILQVCEGSVSEIGPRDLCARDRDTPPEGLHFVVTPPTSGHLALKSAPTRHIFNFTQALIDQGQLLFAHNGDMAGGFNFQVNDGVNFAPPQDFSVVATPLVLRLERNRPLQVISGSTAPIHREVLLAVTNDNNAKGNRTVLFSVTSPPELGVLVNMGSDITAEIFSFTQKMVNEGVVVYKHKLIKHVEGTALDAFTFTLSSPPASLKAQIFHIQISPSIGPEGKGLLYLNTGAVVAEGGRVVIDKSKLDASNLLDRAPKAQRQAYEICYQVTSLPKHGVIVVGQANLTNQNPHFSQSILNEEGITYLHDDSEVAHDSFTFSVRLEQKDELEQLWQGDSKVEASFYITVTPVNDHPPLLKTVAPSLWVPQGDVVALGSDNLNVVDLDNSPEDLKYTVIQEPSNGFLAMEGRLDEPILTFTQANINNGMVYFVHDGSPFSGLAYLSVSDGKHRPVYMLFHLQVAEGVSPVTNRGLILEQGQTSVILTRELLPVVTNEKDANIHYQVTRPPYYGKLLMHNEVATSFDQEDLWLGKLSYHMVDLSSSHDSFEFTAFMSEQNVTKQSVNISVKPLIRIGAGLRIPNSIAVKLGKDLLDATVLAVLSGSDPLFEILPPQRRSEVVHILITKDGASQPISAFSFKDVEQGRLSITVTTNLAGVQQLNGSIPFILRADNVQPARGEIPFTVVPNDSARVVPIQTLRSPVRNHTEEDLLHNTSDSWKPPKRFHRLNGRNRGGSHNRSRALLHNFPRATWSMQDTVESNTTVRTESFPRQASNNLLIVLPVLAILLLTVTLAALTLVSCYHSKKERANCQNLSKKADPGGSNLGQVDTNTAPPSVICPTLTLSCLDNPILGQPGRGTLDPIAGLKDPSLLLCGLDRESAQHCLDASSAQQHKQYWL